MAASWTELLSSTIMAQIQPFLILTNSGDRALAMLASSAAPLMAIRVEAGVRILGRFHEIQTLLDQAIAHHVTLSDSDQGSSTTSDDYTLPRLGEDNPWHMMG